MPYVAHITVPVVFHAQDDAEALDIVTMLRTLFADVSLRDIPDEFGPEISDYPQAELSEVLPYESPRSIAVEY